MADLRVLKLALLAETKDFVKGLDQAEKNTKSFSQKLGGAVKKAALAFAALGVAAGAAAIKIGKDAVKAAIEDEASQKRLAIALKNSTDATDGQIKSVEAYITKAQNATGVTDIKLRAAFANLTRVTKDTTKAQELNNIALDIAAVTGKDLEQVSESLAKAVGGNTTALQRLDPSLRDIIKSGATTDEVIAALAKNFAGGAAAAADTFAGRMEIVKRRIEDAQETLGKALLPVLERVAKFISEKVVPAIEGLVRGLTGGPNSVQASGIRTADGLERFAEGLDENDTAGFNLGKALRDLALGFGRLFEDVEKGAGPEGTFARMIEKITGMAEALLKLIEQIDRAIEAFGRLREASAGIGERFAPGGTTARDLGVGGVGSIQAARMRNQTNVNINVRGAVDENGTARRIVNLIGKATTSTGLTFANRAALR
jgi:hypothetical protein